MPGFSSRRRLRTISNFRPDNSVQAFEEQLKRARIEPKSGMIYPHALVAQWIEQQVADL